MALSLLRSGLVGVLLVVAYFVLPLRLPDIGTLVWLLSGLLAVGVLLAWHVRAIIGTATYPRLRAIGAVATGLPLLLVVFAVAYLLLERAHPGSFNQPLDRLAALYYTVTIFATVGFGDIAPVAAAARAITTVQMVVDVVAIGLIAKLLVGAVETGMRRRKASGEDTDDGSPTRRP
jgi:hypothetical protein